MTHVYQYYYVMDQDHRLSQTPCITLRKIGRYDHILLHHNYILFEYYSNSNTRFCRFTAQTFCITAKLMFVRFSLRLPTVNISADTLAVVYVAHGLSRVYAQGCEWHIYRGVSERLVCRMYSWHAVQLPGLGIADSSTVLLVSLRYLPAT